MERVDASGETTHTHTHTECKDSWKQDWLELEKQKHYNQKIPIPRTISNLLENLLRIHQTKFARQRYVPILNETFQIPHNTLIQMHFRNYNLHCSNHGECYLYAYLYRPICVNPAAVSLPLLVRFLIEHTLYSSLFLTVSIKLFASFCNPIPQQCLSKSSVLLMTGHYLLIICHEFTLKYRV